MILSRSLGGPLYASFGPIPWGWRIRSCNFSAYPVDPSLSALLGFIAGFVQRPLTFTGQLVQESNQIITGPLTVGQGVFVVNYPAGLTGVFPSFRYSLPTVLPSNPYDNFLGLQYLSFDNCQGVVDVDLIPLSPREISRNRSFYVNYADPEFRE